jgi:ABC-type glycerol-3-phosphate transport system substrate-binding protein
MPRTARAGRRSTCLIAVVALATLAAGCGGKSSSSQSTSAASTSAADWANGLCSAVSTWSTSVKTTTTSLKGNVTEDSLKSASADVTKATDEFVHDLKGLGTPDTESGKKAKETLDTLAGQLKTNVQTIDKAVNEVSGTSGALQAVSTVSSTLVTVGDQVTTAFTSIQQLDTKGELDKAFRNSEECKALNKQGS